MLRQLLTKDVPTIKKHIQNQQENGPLVVARIVGFSDLLQVYDVREEMYPRSSSQKQECWLLQGLPDGPPLPRRLEVQISPHRRLPWHIAQSIYLQTEEQ
ncbi:hypothetical protein [Tengunoibacter tsumagoiensis]|uniref:Uncharacterized protein n=1 Tax=Tengunoibacter tsumagoiensis TaxID=2014871 RepID=A0A402A7X0_9CHLR|nr:hypothetical protein [Tengunoibacter tsumagoiensis]GCE15081.1 hypothetical protein KTT_49400 [Tengunoibacter tsumagoiensis]